MNDIVPIPDEVADYLSKQDPDSPARKILLEGRKAGIAASINSDPAKFARTLREYAEHGQICPVPTDQPCPCRD